MESGIHKDDSGKGLLTGASGFFQMSFYILFGITKFSKKLEPAFQYRFFKVGVFYMSN